jgi:hypothetical protein
MATVVVFKVFVVALGVAAIKGVEWREYGD